MKGDKAFSDALKMLGRRDYSEAEMAEALGKSFPEDVVSETLSRLREIRFIDDNSLADRLTQRYLDKGKGLYYIMAVLKRRKIGEGAVEKAFTAFDYDKELAGAAQYLSKNSGKKGLQALKLGLKSRGFSRRSAERALRETLNKR